MKAVGIKREKIRARGFTVKNTTGMKKAVKEIEKRLGKGASSEVRASMIESAYYVRDAVANNAPKQIYSDIIMGEPLEKFENRNAGFDFALNGRMEATFFLSLSTTRFDKTNYKGYNPIIGLLVSNYGRQAQSAPPGTAIPVPTYKRGPSYNHPQFGTGYNNRFAGMNVKFAQHVAGIAGTHWIEEAVQGSTMEVKRILKGDMEYTEKTTTARVK